MANKDGELDLSGSPKIEVLANPGARGGYGLNEAHFTAVSGPLFPSDPSPADIMQQKIADCYLLAAVVAILARNRGPETVAGMMKEVNGRVVVRLYDNARTPHYVSIEKSIRKHEEKHNGGAIWATLLEKAYAAAAFVEENKRPEGKNDGKVLVGYAKLNAGGKSDVVFKTLLGGDAEHHLVDSGIWGETAGLSFLALWTVDETMKLEQARIAKLIKDVFGGNGGLWQVFLQWRSIYVKQQWEILLDAHGDIEDSTLKTIRRRQLRLEDLAEFFLKFNLDRDCAATVMDYVRKNHLLPGKRGTGTYTDRQIAIFQRIQKLLLAGKALTLSSTQEVATVAVGKGRSAKESMGKGLVGKHVYAVIGVREDNLRPFLKWVRVRNPWGDTGREYYPSPKDNAILKARATDAGEFDLELSDVTKRFETTYASGLAVGG